MAEPQRPPEVDPGVWALFLDAWSQGFDDAEAWRLCFYRWLAIRNEESATRLIVVPAPERRVDEGE